MIDNARRTIALRFILLTDRVFDELILFRKIYEAKTGGVGSAWTTIPAEK